MPWFGSGVLPSDLPSSVTLAPTRSVWIWIAPWICVGASSLYAATRTVSIRSSGLPRSGSLWMRCSCLPVATSTALMFSTYESPSEPTVPVTTTSTPSFLPIAARHLASPVHSRASPWIWRSMSRREGIGTVARRSSSMRNSVSSRSTTSGAMPASNRQTAIF